MINREIIPLMYKGFLFKENKDGKIYPENLANGMILNIHTTETNINKVKKLIDTIKTN